MLYWNRHRESVVKAIKLEQVVRDLLGCCELNIDEMETHTRETISKAKELLQGD